MSEGTFLGGVEMFEDFGPEDREALRAASGRLDLARGDAVFQEGDEADALYVVESGRVAIGNRSPDGRESTVALMEAGAVFGEMGLFDHRGRSADARVLEAGTLTTVPYDALRAVFEARPTLLWGVVRLLSRRLRTMDTALADAFFLDVTGRTAKHLLELAGDKDEFEIPVTQEELAGLIGASRERVNKAISQFQRLGWLEQIGGSYVIVKRRELEIRSS